MSPRTHLTVMELSRNTYFNAQCIRLDGGIRMPPR